MYEEEEFTPYVETSREKQIRHRMRLIKRMRNIITDFGNKRRLGDYIRRDGVKWLEWYVLRNWDHPEMTYFHGLTFERHAKHGARRRFCKAKRSNYMSRAEYTAWQDAQSQIANLNAHKIRIK